MRFAVLVSGSGTNLQALLDCEKGGKLAPGEIVLVISNRPGVGALGRARSAGKPTLVIDHKSFPDRESFERAVLTELHEHRVDVVILAGFMRVLSSVFLEAFPLKVVNTHPSLLPAFPGMHGARQALEHGVKVSGCTVHFVEAGVDTGPIIAQSSVPVLCSDDEQALMKRIQAEEHKLLPKVAQSIAAGHVRCDGRKVKWITAVEN